MSHLIPSGSPKRAKAERFGRSLAVAMARRKVGSRVVAEMAGVGRSSVMNWRAGRTLPRWESAVALADGLAEPQLLTLLTELRTGACQVCDREYLDDTGSGNRRFCSEECQDVAALLRVGVPVRLRAARAERRLEEHVGAVARFCGWCAGPSGACPDVECALRSVSPLKLASQRSA